MITEANWAESYYKNDQQAAIAFISSGAEPSSDGLSIVELYFVTMTNFDRDQEYYQQTFKDLKTAIGALSQKYSHWEFSDGQKGASSGCGDCGAH